MNKGQIKGRMEIVGDKDLELEANSQTNRR